MLSVTYGWMNKTRINELKCKTWTEKIRRRIKLKIEKDFSVEIFVIFKLDRYYLNLAQKTWRNLSQNF